MTSRSQAETFWSMRVRIHRLVRWVDGEPEFTARYEDLPLETQVRVRNMISSVVELIEIEGDSIERI